MDDNRTESLQDIKLYTVTEMESVLGVSHATLMRWIRAGKLKSRKVGGKWRTTEAEIRQFIAESKRVNPY